MDINKLSQLTSNASAIRRCLEMQPVGGKGDKLFPPTYPGSLAPTHIFETRRIGGENVLCVLIDSVQSQANRLEEALLEQFELPRLEVDFREEEDLADIGTISSLEAPHRAFDAIIRDSEFPDGSPFVKSEVSRQLQGCNLRNALSLFEHSPTDLIFGVWNSTGESGGLGAKFPRCLVSEIIGVGVAKDADGNPSGKRMGSRLDPLGIRRDVEIYRDNDSIGGWSTEKPKSQRPPKKALRPSEINHGNILSKMESLGVTVDVIEHRAVLSFAGLRRLSFPSDGEARNDTRDTVGRTVLAALGLAAITAQDTIGYALRSRCDLCPQEKKSDAWEIVYSDGRVESFALNTDLARKLLESSVKKAMAEGLPWHPKPLLLKPSKRLAELVRKSRENALASESTAEKE